MKLLFLACCDVDVARAKLTAGRGNAVWKIALNQFDIMFPAGCDVAHP